MTRYRALGPEDQPAWRDVRLEALRLYPRAFLTSHEEQLARTEGQDRELLSKGRSRGLFEDTDLVAIGALVPVSHAACQHRADVGAIYVRQAAQGRGLGRTLMRAIIDEARGLGLLQLELGVATDNHGAIALYESLGFQQFGRHPRVVMTADWDVDDFLYVLMLDR